MMKQRTLALYHTLSSLIVAGTLALPPSLSGQALPIFLDGRFDDWATATATYVDTEGDGTFYDFKSFSVANDDQFLFIRFELIPEMKLLENNNLTLYIDGDHDASSGLSVNGIGADLRWNFGARSGTFYRGSNPTIRFRHIQMRVLPTHTSTEYELAIGRDVLPNNVNPLFSSDSIRIVFRDESPGGDMMPDAGETFTYVFDPTPVEPLTPTPLERIDTTHLRVMSYNVYNDGLTDPARQPRYRRILQAIEPDIICFNEMWTTTAPIARAVLDTLLPLGGGRTWHTVKLDAGNITASRYPIVQNWLVLPGFRITASLIDLAERQQGQVLVINAHFRCCEADSLRQREADAVVEFLLDAKAPGGRITLSQNTPFMLVGDLNLVGFHQQLHTLLTGEIVNVSTFGPGGPPDWDDTDLADLISRQADKRMAYTWRNDQSTYSPGRLDYFIYSNSVAGVARSFILQTETMSTDRLILYGLQQIDTRSASDHLPHVADFIIGSVASIPPEESGTPQSFRLEQNYPNPFNPSTTIRFTLRASGFTSLKIFDVLGREVATLIDDELLPGHHEVTWDAAGAASGVYIARLSSGEYSNTMKLVLIR